MAEADSTSQSAGSQPEAPVKVEVAPEEVVAASRVAVEGTQAAPPLKVRNERTHVPRTADQALWSVVRYTTNAITYDRYEAFIEPMMCGTAIPPAVELRRSATPFTGVSEYSLLKAATEVFLMTHCGIQSGSDNERWAAVVLDRGERNRVESPTRVLELREEWERNYLVDAPAGPELPYIALIRTKLGLPVVEDDMLGQNCHGLLQSKLKNPCFVELLWSYWMEEGMIVQTMNAISMRFQNRRRPGDRDPLLKLDIDPLRPLSAILWGWVQDEQHRLSVARRAHEYGHQYGLTLAGKAVLGVRTAELRDDFIPKFHKLLYECVRFFEVDDDTTKVADGFPVLRELKKVHLVVTDGGHNQYGELPWVARIEMLMMQWILARPELREYLGGRGMIAYPEPWMEQVESMKTLQRWTDSNITYFRDLAIFGEQLLLTIRFGAWSTVIYPQNAANWVRYWRPEIQGYIDAYQTVTGVDVGVKAPDGAARASVGKAPSAHLEERLAEQQRKVKSDGIRRSFGGEEEE